ncbi:ATP-binding protein [Microbacterium sp.]|uniref:HAMP domain-containing sensor histidine kinase n=1 Tax=Microbacterium sp. TaxID=51671 RepID=UPI0025FA15DC|nr:ATP-binding protein [Microbacterium sp.]
MTGFTLLMLAVQNVPFAFYLTGVERERMVTTLERDAFVLAGRLEDLLEAGTAATDPAAARVVAEYSASSGARVVVVDAEGVAVATSDADQSRVGASYASRPEFAAALEGRIATGERDSETLGVRLLYVAVPVLSAEGVLGSVRLSYPAQVVTDAAMRQVWGLLPVAATTVVLAGLVAFVFASGVTRRLRLLQAATDGLARGDLESRAEEGAGVPEVRSLARSFNLMAERLQALIELQRSFASDASHQLRTPLTALRLRLEGASELIESDPDAAAERLAAADAELDRLGSLIEGLLTLSRAEAESATTAVYDVAAIARERVEQWMPLGQEAGITIRYEGATVAPAVAIETALEQVVDNFIDNALGASSAGSTITVRVESTDRVTVHVLDEGPGLSPAQRARAFDRFWRGSSDGEGSGLGLAIVERLARASGGSARLEPRTGGGLDASLTLPGAPR